jgi:hypothetical protein
LQIRRGLGIGLARGADRDGDDHRRGPIGSEAQAARLVNFPDTLMRHFLLCPVAGLPLRMIAAAGG